MSRQFARTILLGPTGSGKSSLLRAIVAQRNEGSEFIFVTDLHRLYPCQRRFRTSDEMMEFFERDNPPPGTYCADFGTLLEESNIEAWNDFFDIVDWISGLSAEEMNYPVTLMVDEAIEFSNSIKTAACLEKFVRYSRFAKVDLYFCSMRPLGVHPLIRINCNRVIVFAQNRKTDLKDIMDYSALSDSDFSQIRKLSRFSWTAKNPLPVRGRHFLIFPDDSISPPKSGKDSA